MDFLRPPPPMNRHRDRRNRNLYVSTNPAVTSPLSVPGCVGWYDYSDLSKLTLSGSDITNVTDKSLQGANLADGGGTNKWKSGVVTQNGLATASNNNATSCHLVSGSNVYGAPGNWTIFIVGMSTSAAAGSKAYAGGDFTAGGSYALFRNVGTNDFKYFENVGSAGTSVAGACPNNVWQVLEFDCASGSGATVRYGVDTAAASAGWPSRSLSLHRLGSNGTDALLGAVGEVAIYNTRLNTSQRQSLQNWFKGKWAL